MAPAREILSRGPDGQMYPPWDPAQWPMPAHYPEPKRRGRPRAATPPVRAMAPQMILPESGAPQMLAAQRSEQAMSKAMTGMLRGVAGEVRRAAVRAREGAGAPRRQAPRGRRGRLSWLRMPRTSTFVPGAFGVLLLTLAGEPSFVREVSRTVGAVADVAEGAGTLAGAVNFAAANTTVAVTTTAANIATSSLSLAREIWLGVNLLNVSANRSHGRMIAESLDEVRGWAVDEPTFANMAVDVELVL